MSLFRSFIRDAIATATPTIPTPTTISPSLTASPGAVPFGPAGGGGGGPSSYLVAGNQPMPNIVIPPGGFAGFAQQTPATQALFARAGRKGGLRSAAKRRRKRKTKAKTTRTRTRRTRSTRRKARLVKGSAAAKRYMARIRKMRKR